MKKTNLIFSFLLLFISSACSQNENYPPIQDFDECSFELIKIIDGIDIPWGLAFTDNDNFYIRGSGTGVSSFGSWGKV